MSDPNFKIETPRLTISYLFPENDTHCDFLVRLYNTPEFIASIGGASTSITTRERARERLAGRFRDEHARNGYGTYLASLKDSGTLVGTVSLKGGENDQHDDKQPGGEKKSYKAPDLGFAVLPEHMRRGYAREAARALLEYVEREKGVTDVLGLHDPANEASRAVFRSLGFEDRGVRVLEVFGGVVGAVWTKPGMAEDLSVYGLPRDGPEVEEGVGKKGGIAPGGRLGGL